jgi:hypothetical protein
MIYKLSDTIHATIRIDIDECSIATKLADSIENEKLGIITQVNMYKECNQAFMLLRLNADITVVDVDNFLKKWTI